MQFEAIRTVDPNTISVTESPYADEIKNWTTYTHYLAAFAGVILTVDQVCNNAIKDPDEKKKVDGALHALYTAVQGVDNEFISGIDSMKEGNPPEYDFPPTPIPPFPDPDDKKGLFKAAWQVVQSALMEWESHVKGGGPFQTAIVGLIATGNQCVEILDEAFGL